MLSQSFTIGGRLLGGCALLGVCLLSVSCGSGGKKTWNKLPTVPTQGQVFINDQPAVGAMVRLVPTTSLDNVNPGGGPVRPQGGVDDTGAYKLTTFESNDGAPVGYTYNIAITMYEPTAPVMMRRGDTPDPPDMLEKKYEDAEKNAQANSGMFSVTIPEDAKGSFEIKRIDLNIEGFWERMEAKKQAVEEKKESRPKLQEGQAAPAE